MSWNYVHNVESSYLMWYTLFGSDFASLCMKFEPRSSYPDSDLVPILCVQEARVFLVYVKIPDCYIFEIS